MRGHLPDPVPALRSMLAAVRRGGWVLVEDVDVVQPVLRTPDEIRVHARTVEAIAGPVVSQGLATVEEIDDLVSGLDA